MLLRFLLFTIFSVTFCSDTYDNKLLICLDKNFPDLELNNDGKLQKGLNNDLINILSKYGDYKISKWLTAASDEDISGDIQLNKIYEITINELNRFNLNSLKSEIEL